MGYKFREEEINEMYQLYQETLEAIHDQTKGIAEELTEHAKRMTYEPVIELAVESINYYNYDLKMTEKKALADWQDSDLSFTAIMRLMRAGEEAEAESRRLEGNIESQIESWRGLDSSQLSGITSKYWEGDTKDFEIIRQAISNFVVSLEDLLGQMASRIAQKKDQNEIYISIEPVILQSIQIVIEGFRQGISESFDELARGVEENVQIARSRASQTAQNINLRSKSSVSDGVAALKAKVKNILE